MMRGSNFAMSAVTRALACGVIACLLFACGKPEPKNNPQPPPKKADDNVFAPMVGTKDRAKAAGQAVEDSGQKVREEVNKQAEGEQ